MQISGRENTNDEIDRLFLPSFYERFIQKYLTPKDDLSLTDELRKTLILASDAYIGGIYDLEDQVPESIENAALERVNKSIWELYEALMDLMDVGKSDEKLAEQIKGYADYDPEQTERTLYDLYTRDPSQSAHYFREMLMDLLLASEQAQNIQPKRSREQQGVILTEQALANDNKNWRSRRAKSRISKQLPLIEFSKIWHKFWLQHSSVPYTEGKYVSELGTTKSLAVDAVEEIMQILDTSVARSAIIAVIKKTKKGG